jgi:Protein of unknown function (DUF2934)
MKHSLSNASSNASLNATELLEDQQIRLRAYELYEQRGREDGRDVEDWLQAESDVFGQRASPSIESIAA